jgi:hypothetical protein
MKEPYVLERVKVSNGSGEPLKGQHIYVIFLSWKQIESISVFLLI